MQTSSDAQQLMKTAVEYARSDRPADHRLLLDSLGSESFLTRLDTMEEYRGPAKQLRLAQVLAALMSNKDVERVPVVREA